MATGSRYRVPFKRRREGKTNYRKRLAILKSELPRVVVRKTLTKTIVQVIAFDPRGDKVLASSVSSELRKHGWKGSTANTPAAYLAGYLAGKRAVASGISEAVLDIGMSVPSKGSLIFGAAKGVLDAGLQMPLGEDVVPSEDRLNGKFLGAEMEKQFSEIKSKLEA